MRIRSLLHTNIAYDGGREARAAGKARKVELKPGLNDVSAADFEVLRMDPFYPKHVERGFYVEVPEEKPAPPPATPPPAPPVKLSKSDTKAVADFLALDATGQEAVLPTLTDAQRAAVEAAKAKST